MKNRFLLVALFCLSTAGFIRAQIINTFPHTQNFESFTLCGSACGAACLLSSGWMNDTTDQTDWAVFSGPTPTANTGPDADHTLGTPAGKYLYVESSSCSNLTASLLSPQIDLTGLANLSMDFWYHLYGNNLGTIHVDVSTDGGLNFTNDVVPSWTQNSNGWAKATINLSSYLDDTVVVRVRGVTGNGSLSDIGIDDFRFYTVQGGTDAGMISIDSPVTPFSAGTHNVAVSIRNFGTVDLTSVSIGWMLNGIAQTPYLWSDTLLSGEFSTPIIIGSYNFPQGTIAVKVWTYNPNGVADSDAANDTLERTVCPGLSGSFAIGGTTPDFTGFNDAINSLLFCGINGAVTFIVSAGSGPYNEQVTIRKIPGASAVNTITFNGNGEMIKASGNASDRHVIKLDGARHIIFDSLNINGAGISYAWGIHLLNAADSNVIRNCVIDVSASTSTSVNNSGGIIASASTLTVNTAGNNAGYLTIENNTIIGGFQGIRIHGQNFGSKNNRITGNTIRDFYSYGIYLSDCDNALVSGNNISRANLTNVGTFYGVHLDARVVRTLIEKNRIHGTHNSAMDLTALSHGISISNADATAGNENMVVNNVIYDFNGNGTIYGIYNSGSNGARYYHNTVSLDHAASSGGTTRGFYQTMAASNIVFKNNIVTVMRGGSGAMHCMYLGDSLSSVSSGFNVFFIDTGARNVGYWKGADYRTLSDWQAANAGAYDGNSVFANPAYANAAGGNLAPASPLVNDAGDSLGVTADILGNVRDAGNPDPGAYEFSPPANDASLAWVSPIPPVSAGNKVVTVNLANSASSQDTIKAATLSYDDGTTPVTQSFSGLNIPPAGSQNLSFTWQYNLAGFVTLKAYINDINGITEFIPTNDTAAMDICPYLSGGGYTVNKTAPASATNFQSVQAAMDRISTCGINGNVTFNISTNTGPYVEQVEIAEIPGAGAGDSLTINGNGNTIQADPSPAKQAIISLNGADYVTLNNLALLGTDTTYGWGIHLYSQADHNTISNCTINLPFISAATPDEAAGIVATASTDSLATPGNTTNYTTITNCQISGGGQGIRLNGSSAGKAAGNRIVNNTIQNFHSYGIYLSNTDSAEISGNDIHRANRIKVGPFYGITLSSGCENSLIERNRIRSTHDNATDLTGLAYGIYSINADAAAGRENRAVNNLIYDMNGNGAITAISNVGSDNAEYYHNTIVLDDASATTTSETRGFSQETTAANVDFRNNIVYVKRGGAGAKHCIHLEATGSTVTSDNNVLYMNASGTNNHVGRFGSTDYTTLTDWQTANGSTFDQNSAGADPVFANAAGDNFTPTNLAIDNIGTDGLGVATDFNLDSRSGSSPDAGAFEFSAASLDAALTWVSPAGASTSGQKTITVNVSNLQSATITGIMLSYTDGNSVITQTFNSLSIDSGSNQDLSFTATYNFTATTYLRAYIESVNGATDDNRLNDTTGFQLLCLPLNGTFTINAGAPVALPNFQSFTDAVNALVTCGISGPVVLEVDSASGPYNEQITIPFISGSSAANTVTFEGNNSTLSFSPDSSARHVLMLNGAKHVVLHDLRIAGTSTNYGFGIVFTNAADSNTVSGCTVDVSAVTNTSSVSNSCGILFSGSNVSATASGNNGSHNMISGNSIIGGHHAIRINGFTADHNRIENNTVRYFYAYGIYLQDADGTDIISNNITRANRVDVTTFNGIFLSSGNVNTNIERNRIHNTHDNAANRAQASNAINFTNCDAPAGQENRIINNAIYNMNGQGATYGIFNSSSDGAFYYHNSISLDEADSIGGETIGFRQTSFADNIDFRNNVVSVKRGGAGNKYCVSLGATTSNITCDYNIFYVPSAATYFVGQFGTTNYATMPLWQSVNGNSFDQDSWFADPLFGSSSTGNLLPLNGALDNKGAPLGITDDITGASRNMLTPDIGAFEFTPSQFDAAVVTLLEPADLSCATGAISVKAVVGNFGTDTINSASVTSFISGPSFSDTLTGVTSAPLANAEQDTVQLGSISFATGGRLTFTVVVSLPNDGNISNDTAVFVIDINSSTAQPQIQAYNDSLCSGLTSTISVVSNPGLTYAWYDVSSGGTPVYTGVAFTTPVLDSSVTYYVEASSPFNYSVGPADTSIGSGGYFANVGGQGLLFDVFKNLTIDSVSVYAGDTGTVYVEVTNPSNSMIFGVASAPVQTAGAKVKIPVGINLAPGSYRIDASGSTAGSLYRNTTGANYPYAVPGIISINGTTNIPANYFFFYDWKITAYECPSTRTSAPIVVDPSGAVVATFTYSIGGSGLEVNFNADDTSAGNSLTWDFGDAENGTGDSVAHQYDSDGSYTACLTSSNTCAQDSTCQTLTICETFQSGFSYNATGLSVSFLFNGSGQATSHLWDFGDSTVSMDAAPTHNYTASGTYTVTLINENFCGVSDTSSQTFTICEAAAADFTYSRVSELEFNFNSTSTGNPTALLWDFGDGTSDTSAAVVHAFPAHANYDVMLIVTDACGDRDTSVQTVITCEAVNADFDFSRVSGLSFDFTSTSGGNPSALLWNFDDGATDTSATVTHTFQSHGNYDVMLIAEDGCGNSDTLIQTVSTCAAISADFIAAVQGDNKTVNTVNNSTGSNLTYAWNFGDTVTSALENPTHAYSATGTYTITLTVTDACGQTDAATQSVSVIVVGIAGINSTFYFAVYPNPNDGEFVLSYNLTDESKVQVKFVNLLGEIVYEASETNFAGEHTRKISLTQLPKGVYALYLSTDHAVAIKRVVVN